MVATYGRGFCILDDLTPLRAVDAAIAHEAGGAAQAARQYRFRTVAEPFTEMDDIVAGKNPPTGAALNYWIARAEGHDAKDSVTITVAERRRRDRAHAQGAGEGGAQPHEVGSARASKTKEAMLRASPLYENWFEVEEVGQARARHRPVRDARAAGHVHGDAEARRRAGLAAARGAQGSGLGRKRADDRDADGDGARASWPT